MIWLILFFMCMNHIEVIAAAEELWIEQAESEENILPEEETVVQTECFLAEECQPEDNESIEEEIILEEIIIETEDILTEELLGAQQELQTETKMQGDEIPEEPVVETEDTLTEELLAVQLELQAESKVQEDDITGNCDIEFCIFLEGNTVRFSQNEILDVKAWSDGNEVYYGISLEDIALTYGSFGFFTEETDQITESDKKFIFTLRGETLITEGKLYEEPDSGKTYISYSCGTEYQNMSLDIYYLPKGRGEYTTLEPEVKTNNSFYSVEIKGEGQGQIYYALCGETCEIDVSDHNSGIRSQADEGKWVCIGADGTVIEGTQEGGNNTRFTIEDIAQSYMIQRAGKEVLSIIYENGTHYIIDPEYPDEKITLFCMNNKLHWPHHTNEMGNVQVPNYTEGYLKPDDFASPEDYAECMRRLSKLLYAGYPYNGERLYKIVENVELYIPTETEFNEMLIVPTALQKAFPYLGHHAFTYQDWVGQDKEHLTELADFIRAVGNLYPNGQTENGLTYSDITAMPFYKAALTMLNATDKDNPLTVFTYFYPGSYFVTEEQAYNATQKAVWRLLNFYNIPNNDISNLNDTQLGQILYTYSERGGLLNYEPSLNDIHLSGSLKFRYNPKDGLWHSGVLQVIEPSEYHGIYHLELPKGMTALCDTLSYVYGNEEYELVSDHEPTTEETFGIRAEFIWLKEFKQYSPNPDIEVNGKKFQHMVGAVIRNKKISANVPVGVNKVGSLSITKSVVGKENCQEAFEFELRLPYHTSINGLYGDLEFHNGVANFSLKDTETKTATNLPEGAIYEVIEYETKQYQVGMTNNKGEIVKDVTTEVRFTNTKCPDFTLTKIVTGEAGDKTKLFTFVIQLTNKDGNPVNGDYEYKGSVKEGTENETTTPDNGKLTFNNGTAEISLAHGQQITLLNLPPNATYKVTEKEANQEHYTTTYNGKKESAEGVLNDDHSVEVVNNKEFVPDTGITDTNNHSISVGIIISLMAIGSLLFVCLFRWRKELRK